MKKIPTVSCAIYENRPKMCRVYPQIDDMLPSECTYWFAGPERHGECACDVGACCAVLREGGEPTGRYLSELDGGAPCKHLVWGEEEASPADTDVEKVAFVDIQTLIMGPIRDKG